MFSRLMSIVNLGDKRKERRAKVLFSAELGSLKGRVTDISLGGIGFYPDEEGLEVGDEVMATLTPDEFTTFEIPCRIVGMDEEGMILCVQFLEIREDQFDSLQDTVAHPTIGGGSAKKAAS